MILRNAAQIKVFDWIKILVRCRYADPIIMGTVASVEKMDDFIRFIFLICTSEWNKYFDD